MQMNEHDLRETVQAFERAGMTDIFMQPRPDGETFGVMIFARKGACA